MLELVPTALTHMITQRVRVPTIGIGAGPFSSGQVQVWHDILGLYDDLRPKHARRFAEVGDVIRGALREYVASVQSGEFPTAEESFYMDERALELIRRMTPGAEHDMSEAERVLSELQDAPAPGSEHRS